MPNCPDLTREEAVAFFDRPELYNALRNFWDHSTHSVWIAWDNSHYDWYTRLVAAYQGITFDRECVAGYEVVDAAKLAFANSIGFDLEGNDFDYQWIESQITSIITDQVQVLLSRSLAPDLCNDNGELTSFQLAWTNSGDCSFNIEGFLGYIAGMSAIQQQNEINRLSDSQRAEFFATIPTSKVYLVIVADEIRVSHGLPNNFQLLWMDQDYSLNVRGFVDAIINGDISPDLIQTAIDSLTDRQRADFFDYFASNDPSVLEELRGIDNEVRLQIDGLRDDATLLEETLQQIESSSIETQLAIAQSILDANPVPSNLAKYPLKRLEENINNIPDEILGVPIPVKEAFLRYIHQAKRRDYALESLQHWVAVGPPPASVSDATILEANAFLWSIIVEPVDWVYTGGSIINDLITGEADMWTAFDAVTLLLPGAWGRLDDMIRHGLRDADDAMAATRVIDEISDSANRRGFRTDFLDEARASYLPDVTEESRYAGSESFYNLRDEKSIPQGPPGQGGRMINQGYIKSCGAACAAQVLRDIGVNVDEDRMIDLLGTTTDLKGTNMMSPRTQSGLIEALKGTPLEGKYRFKTHVLLDSPNSQQAVDIINAQGGNPLIVQVDKIDTKGVSHVVIVDGIQVTSTETRVLIRDPWGKAGYGANNLASQGWLPLDEFTELFRFGVFIELVKIP